MKYLFINMFVLFEFYKEKRLNLIELKVYSNDYKFVMIQHFFINIQNKTFLKDLPTNTFVVYFELLQIK